MAPSHLPFALLLPLLPVIAPLAATATTPLCPKPALDRLINHRVSEGESLTQIAQRYKLIPATIMGFNPSARGGNVTPGQVLIIPPFNGVQVTVPPNTSLKALAAQYRVRADVLFEINGCQSAPTVAFIPGISRATNQADNPDRITVQPTIAAQFPLANRGEPLMDYGRPIAASTQSSAPTIHAGIDWPADVGTPVFAAADGVVAFVGEKDNYGQLIVINHAQGYQTRYGHLSQTNVQLGQTLRRGQAIGQVGQTGQPHSRDPHLHFELRTKSSLGWVAEDPRSLLTP
jgi:murein DD-endopeptidase MepM/ murein hydrolase activator NlpD